MTQIGTREIQWDVKISGTVFCSLAKYSLSKKNTAVLFMVFDLTRYSHGNTEDMAEVGGGGGGETDEDKWRGWGQTQSVWWWLTQGKASWDPFKRKRKCILPQFTLQINKIYVLFFTSLPTVRGSRARRQSSPALDLHEKTAKLFT